MVCDKCEKKLGKVITPDPWKAGARNTVESGGRKVNENKAVTASKNRFNPYTSKFECCRYVYIIIIHKFLFYENPNCGVNFSHHLSKNRINGVHNLKS